MKPLFAVVPLKSAATCPGLAANAAVNFAVSKSSDDVVSSLLPTAPVVMPISCNERYAPEEVTWPVVSVRIWLRRPVR